MSVHEGRETSGRACGKPGIGGQPTLRLKQKVALPNGGLRPRLAEDQVFSDRNASDEEHESSTKE